VRKISFLLTMLIFLAASCSSGNATIGTDTNSSTNETVSVNAITNLVCGSQTDCLSKICVSAAKCPLQNALSNKDVFDFVKTLSECEGCDTQTFAPDKGIGKCIEYKIADELQVWTVTFWVSENCKFRHGDPTQSRIVVKISKEISAIDSINPATAYIKDSSYCSIGTDCNGLSGSGVPLIGCSNFLYAPLNWSGYYAYSDDICTCVKNQCKQK
jgi:hypothetical protein